MVRLENTRHEHFLCAPALPNPFGKDSASSAAGGGPQKSTIASLFEPPQSMSSRSRASRPDKSSSPGQDVAEKLKAPGEQLLAVMLITDPVERAKAASDLYKKFAETGKEYAAATADGRAAVAASETAATGAPVDANG